MRILIESLKRLYTVGKVEIYKIDELLATEKITQEEYNYITS